VIVPGGLTMHLTATEKEQRRSLVLILHFFDPGGRNSRARYWLAILLAYLAVFPTLSVSLHDTNSPVAFLAYVGILVAIALLLTAAVSRLHDRGKDGPEHAIVTRYDGTLLHLVAQQNPRPGADDETARLFPQTPRRDGSISGRALLDRAIVHVTDVNAEALQP